MEAYDTATSHDVATAAGEQPECRDNEPSDRTAFLKRRLAEARRHHSNDGARDAHVYYLFGSADGRYDPQELCNQRGATYHSLYNDDYHKAVDKTVWNAMTKDIENQINGNKVNMIIMNPPEATSNEQMRPPDQLYGDKARKNKVAETIRWETCMAQRACGVAELCASKGAPLSLRQTRRARH